MLKSLARNSKIQRYIAGLSAVFVTGWATLEPGVLMNVLNGVFMGTIVATIAAYYRLIVNAIRGEYEYDRVQQMTFGLFILWLSVGVTVGVSIYARSTEYYTVTYTAAAVSRYMAIIAAVMQMRSLDYSYALLHGRDKNLLWFSIILGIIVMIAVIILQTYP